MFFNQYYHERARPSIAHNPTSPMHIFMTVGLGHFQAVKLCSRTFILILLENKPQ